MSFKIFMSGSGVVDDVAAFLRAEGCMCETGDPADTPEDIAGKLRSFNPDGVIVRQGKITDIVQDAAPNLKVISKHGVGTDNIDIEAATKRGIVVTFTPGANSEAVAEHTLALALSLVRMIPNQDRLIHSGIFDKKRYSGTELFGKTVGVIGYGRIGKRVSELFASLGTKVVVYQPSFTDETLPPNISNVATVETLYRQADIISLHVPLTENTRGMIDRSAIAKMQDHVIIINTARGALINEMDLVEALRTKKLNGAALDCFEVEPLRQDHPLLNFENVVVTAHVAGLSDRTLTNMGMQAAKNALAILRKESINPEYVLNRSVLVK